VDLSREIEQSLDRQPDERVRTVRLFGDCYRCNWWVEDKTPHPFWLATGTIRKSRFLRATKSNDQLLIEVVAPEEPAAAKPPRKPTAKRKPAAADTAKALAKAVDTVERLEERNHDAAEALRSLTSLWLSADANRRRGEAEIALNHFDAALAALRKSLAAM
jgi:hypothetical protein